MGGKEYLFSQEIYSVLIWNISAQSWCYLAPVEQPLWLQHRFSLHSAPKQESLLLGLWNRYFWSFRPEEDLDAGRGWFGLVCSWPQEMQICCSWSDELWIRDIQRAELIPNAPKAPSGWNTWKYWANNCLELGWAHCSPWFFTKYPLQT